MKSIIEKYKWYKLGIVKKYVNEDMQRFFKTQPTEEQMLLLSEMLEKDNININAAIMIMLALGIMLGAFIVYLTFYFKYYYGLPIF